MSTTVSNKREREDIGVSKAQQEEQRGKKSKKEEEEDIFVKHNIERTINNREKLYNSVFGIDLWGKSNISYNNITLESEDGGTQLVVKTALAGTKEQSKLAWRDALEGAEVIINDCLRAQGKTRKATEAEIKEMANDAEMNNSAWRMRLVRVGGKMVRRVSLPNGDVATMTEDGERVLPTKGEKGEVVIFEPPKNEADAAEAKAMYKEGRAWSTKWEMMDSLFGNFDLLDMALKFSGGPLEIKTVVAQAD